jgi:alpha-glucosidase
MFGIDLQFFSSNSILVSPVPIYLLKDKFYDSATLVSVEGTNENVTLTNVNFTTILVHTCGGAVLPLRKTGAMTTTELRSKDFEFVVAPDANGTTAGAPSVDDGVSIVQVKSTSAEMSFAEGKLCVQCS